MIMCLVSIFSIVILESSYGMGERLHVAVWQMRRQLKVKLLDELTKKERKCPRCQDKEVADSQRRKHTS